MREMKVIRPVLPIPRRMKPSYRDLRRDRLAGSLQLKVWYDRRLCELLAGADTGETFDCGPEILLSEVTFFSELKANGKSQCIVAGTLVAAYGEDARKIDIRHEPNRSFPDFYWTRDTAWPIECARLAIIAKPRGGFPTIEVIDGQPEHVNLLG